MGDFKEWGYRNNGGMMILKWGRGVDWYLFTDYVRVDNLMKQPPSIVFIGKGVMKICSKFTGEHPCLSVISVKLLCNFIEITLRYGCSPVNLMHIFRTPFPKNTSGRLVMNLKHSTTYIHSNLTLMD